MKDKLEGNDKIIVWVANIINPLIAGFLFYYMWRKTFPNKAKEANRVSFIVAGVGIVIYAFALYWFSVRYFKKPLCRTCQGLEYFRSE